jgi:hypothetical protein
MDAETTCIEGQSESIFCRHNKEKDPMPRNARIPQVDRNRKRLETISTLTVAMKA